MVRNIILVARATTPRGVKRHPSLPDLLCREKSHTSGDRKLTNQARARREAEAISLGPSERRVFQAVGR